MPAGSYAVVYCGLLGEVNPKRGAYDRANLFTSIMIIDQGRQQPRYFFLGEELRLTGAVGGEMVVRILDVAGETALVENWPYVKGKRADAASDTDFAEADRQDQAIGTNFVELLTMRWWRRKSISRICLQ